MRVSAPSRRNRGACWADTLERLAAPPLDRDRRLRPVKPELPGPTRPERPPRPVRLPEPLNPDEDRPNGDIDRPNGEDERLKTEPPSSDAPNRELASLSPARRNPTARPDPPVPSREPPTTPSRRRPPNRTRAEPEPRPVGPRRPLPWPCAFPEPPSWSRGPRRPAPGLVLPGLPSPDLPGPDLLPAEPPRPPPTQPSLLLPWLDSRSRGEPTPAICRTAPLAAAPAAQAAGRAAIPGDPSRGRTNPATRSIAATVNRTNGLSSTSYPAATGSTCLIAGQVILGSLSMTPRPAIIASPQTAPAAVSPSSNSAERSCSGSPSAPGPAAARPHT